MNRRTITTATMVALAFCSVGCQTTGRESQSIHRVDDLLSNIERVHFQSELGGEKVREALGALHQIIAPGKRSGPVQHRAQGQLLTLQYADIFARDHFPPVIVGGRLRLKIRH